MSDIPSIAESIQNIKNAKAAIIQAIIDMDVDVPENAMLADLADYITLIGAKTEMIGGKSYRVVEIGGMTWMAENLDYDYTGAKSHPDYPKFGKYYSKTMASTVADAIQGWHLPTKNEVKTLFTSIGLKVTDSYGEVTWDYNSQSAEDGNAALNTILAKGYTEWPFATNTNGLSIVPGAYWDSNWQSFPTQARYWTSNSDYQIRIDGNTVESDWPEASYAYVGGSDNYYIPIRLVKDAT